jgi:hypothetical protein
MAWLYLNDYLGLGPDEAAAVAGRAIRALARGTAATGDRSM